MRTSLFAFLFAVNLSIVPANAAGGCGPGCHQTSWGACVVDGWGTGARVWNEIPAGARPCPPCEMVRLGPRKRACFQTNKDWL